MLYWSSKHVLSLHFHYGINIIKNYSRTKETIVDKIIITHTFHRTIGTVVLLKRLSGVLVLGTNWLLLNTTKSVSQYVSLSVTIPHQLFGSFSIVSVHYKWNGTRLLSLEVECASCPTSCQMNVLGKSQNWAQA